MTLLSLYALLLVACQGTPPAKPAKGLDSNDPRSVLEHAAYNTRTQKSYETKFKAQLTTSGTPLDYDGRCVWINPGVLYVHYTASGGDEKRIVRAGDKDVWVYDLLVGWVTADEAGMPGAGRGIQNPDEVLAVLARNTGGAKMSKPGVVELTFTGDDIEKIMREQASRGAFNWRASRADLTLAVDAENRLQKFTCDATLAVNNAGGGPSTVKYTAEVTLVAYNEATSLKFLDEKKREIPLLPEMKTKIESVLKEKR
jgi:hypothetical protein